MLGAAGANREREVEASLRITYQERWLPSSCGSSLAPCVNVKQFFPYHGKEFFHFHGKEFFHFHGKEFFHCRGKQFFLPASVQ